MLDLARPCATTPRLLRLGGRDNFFHCDTCGACYSNDLKDNHVCIKGKLKQSCVICLDDCDMQTSRQPVSVIRCGHAMHSSCLDEFIKHSLACPLCKKSVLDPDLIEKQFDEEIAKNPVSDELKDHQLSILCNDCLKESTVNFHPVGLKCLHCRSFNTTRCESEIILPI